MHLTARRSVAALGAAASLWAVAGCGGAQQDERGEFAVRLVDGTLYVKAPAVGEGWVRMAPDNPLADLVDGLDLRSVFDALERGVVRAEYLGVETFDNQSMNGYLAEVRTRAVLADLAGPLVESLRLPETVTYTAYVDGDGMLAGLEADLGDPTAPVRLEFSEWGEPVTIQPPPADQIAS